MSDGETYRVDVSRAAKHWCLMREDLRPVEIRGGGTRLYWPRLCSEMSVATLIGTTEERLATLA
ncbi:MAG: DUF2442 domain-containing protein, partial [Chloroflexi bacterium]|nr:DUF2442 domain-containing protein [Chloroflexota bacterium]